MQQAVLFETLDLLKPPATSKTCNRCGETKPVTDFHRHSAAKGHRAICKSCRSETRKGRQETPDERLTRNLWQNYKLTREQHTALVDAQQGACAICGTAPAEGKRLAVDHCHATGVVRALLCTRRNVAVGFYENYNRAAAEYLATYGAGNPLLKQPCPATPTSSPRRSP